jgi:hypothetical protein
MQPIATIRSGTRADVGEILTLQRAAYVSEAQLYDDAHLPALVQSFDDLAVELEASVSYVAATTSEPSALRVVMQPRRSVAWSSHRISRAAGLDPHFSSTSIGTQTPTSIDSSSSQEIEVTPISACTNDTGTASMNGAR